ncbi:MAG: hypothetical protein RBT03_01185 [Kiritimatiellia bacterium]|jgi:hypothetical protein|nr:hypothetical protein [Kiritimatiellia bacterium]
MSANTAMTWWGRWVGLGLLVAAGWGCARFRSPPPPPPPAVEQPDRENMETTAESSEPAAPEPGADGAPPDKDAEDPAAPERLVVDEQRVEGLQNHELQQQHEGLEQSILRKNNKMTRWLDHAHETWYRRLDNSVRRADTRWLSSDTTYEPELSTFRLCLLGRAGGTSRQDDYDMKVRFRGDVALPGLENKLHLVLENVDDGALPGLDPMSRDEKTQLGLRTVWDTLLNNEMEAGLGLKWRNSNPVVYLELQWKWEREMGGGRLRLNPRGVYYSDEGFGQVTSLSWTKHLNDRMRFQIRTAERSSESREGVNFEQTFRFAWLRSGTGRGWVAQASVFPSILSSDWIWEDTLVNVTWRDAFYRRWIYYTITPQLQFPKVDQYEPCFSIQVGIEILFGGRMRDWI